MAVLAMRDALNQALREEMKRDESVFLLGEDIGLYDGSFKVTRGLMKEFGEKRVLDTPIAEEIIIGTAIGAAMSGLRPVAEMMTVNFIMVAMDQVVNAAAHKSSARSGCSTPRSPKRSSSAPPSGRPCPDFDRLPR